MSLALLHIAHCAHNQQKIREKFSVRTKNVLNIPFYGSFTLCAPLLYISFFICISIWVGEYAIIIILVLFISVCPFAHFPIYAFVCQPASASASVWNKFNVCWFGCVCVCTHCSQLQQPRQTLFKTLSLHSQMWCDVLILSRDCTTRFFCPSFTHAHIKDRHNVPCVRCVDATHTKKSP